MLLFVVRNRNSGIWNRKYEHMKSENGRKQGGLGEGGLRVYADAAGHVYRHSGRLTLGLQVRQV